MLPDFPKLKAEVHQDVLARIRRRVDQLSSILSQLPRFSQHEGSGMRYERSEAPPVESAPEKLGVPVQVLISDVPDLVGAKLNAKIDEIAQDIAKQQSDLFFRKFRESCDEVGNAFDAAGRPLSAELLLEVLSKVQMGFKPNGEPTGQFIINPAMAAALQKVEEELKRDPELKRRHEDILRRQREDWATRESHRKLVD